MNYTYMIRKSGKKGKEWTNAQKGKTRTGHLTMMGAHTRDICTVNGCGEGGGGRRG